jgi:hypothetical protein
MCADAMSANPFMFHQRLLDTPQPVRKRSPSQRDDGPGRAPDVDPADSGASVFRSRRVSAQGRCCTDSRMRLEPVDFLL